MVKSVSGVEEQFHISLVVNPVQEETTLSRQVRPTEEEEWSQSQVSHNSHSIQPGERLSPDTNTASSSEDPQKY